MKAPTPLMLLASVALVLSASPAFAAPAPLATSWTPYPISGFSGTWGARQPKIDSSADGIPTAVWYLSNQEVAVASHNGTSWSCPIVLPAGLMGEGPPDFDKGADGTVAVASRAPGHDAYVYIRPPGSATFKGVGTGTKYPADHEVSVATSGVRTVAVWTSGTRLIGADFPAGATSAQPRILATDADMAFQRVRMDAEGNAVVVFRTIPPDRGDVTQNWLIWPAGREPGTAQRFPLDSPTDFTEIGALQVSPTGRMIWAIHDRVLSSTTEPGAVFAFVGTTTTGFGSPLTVAADPDLRVGDVVTGISSDGAYATVAFREDLPDNSARGVLARIDPVAGTVGAQGTYTQHAHDEIDFFKVLQMGSTAYASWIANNQKPGGVVAFDGLTVTEAMATIDSGWIGLFPAGGEPHAYWPAGSAETLTTTVTSTALNASPSLGAVSVKRGGAVSVAGQVTPGAAAQACAGASVKVIASTLNTSDPRSVGGSVTVGTDGSYSFKLRRSALKGCVKVKVTASLQTPDSTKPVSVSKTVRCTR